MIIMGDLAGDLADDLAGILRQKRLTLGSGAGKERISRS